MRRNLFPNEGQTAPLGSIGVLGDEALQRVGAEGTAAGTRKEAVACVFF
jgi:hypothetical protein